MLSANFFIWLFWIECRYSFFPKKNFIDRSSLLPLFFAISFSFFFNLSLLSGYENDGLRTIYPQSEHSNSTIGLTERRTEFSVIPETREKWFELSGVRDNPNQNYHHLPSQFSWASRWRWNNDTKELLVEEVICNNPQQPETAASYMSLLNNQSAEMGWLVGIQTGKLLPQHNNMRQSIRICVYNK